MGLHATREAPRGLLARTVGAEDTAGSKRIQMSEIQQTRMFEPRGFGSWWRTLSDGVSRRLWLLESEALCAEARRRIGLEDFGDPPDRTGTLDSGEQPGT